MSYLNELSIEFQIVDEQFLSINKKRNELLVKIKSEEKIQKNLEEKKTSLEKARGFSGWDNLDSKFCEIMNNVKHPDIGNMWVANMVIHTDKLLKNKDVKDELILAIGSEIIEKMYDCSEMSRKNQQTITKRFYRQFGRRDVKNIIKNYIVKG